jgi:hypothetical protein
MPQLRRVFRVRRRLGAALAAIKEIEKNWLGVINLNDIAFIYFALGDLDSYFTYVIRATEQHALRYPYVMYCPLFAKSREDPRYQEILDRLQRMTGMLKR